MVTWWTRPPSHAFAGQCHNDQSSTSIRTSWYLTCHSLHARVRSYVEQTDVHASRTTVREALAISAQLRLPRMKQSTLDVSSAALHTKSSCSHAKP
jgi:hypothetical protein